MDKMGEIVGSKINMLEVKGFYRNTEKGRVKVYYNCICECGNEVDIQRNKLITGHTRSCGCFRKKEISKRFKKHGMRETRFYQIWANMKARILNKRSTSFLDYGGRGIGISEDWLEFEGFKKDMYSSYLEHSREYGEADTSIDRIDPDGNYEKSNCRWATKEIQNSNTRNHKRVIEATNIETGEKILGTSKTKLAKETGAIRQHITKVLSGERNHTGGYTFKYLD